MSFNSDKAWVAYGFFCFRNLGFLWQSGRLPNYRNSIPIHTLTLQFQCLAGRGVIVNKNDTNSLK